MCNLSTCWGIKTIMLSGESVLFGWCETTNKSGLCPKNQWKGGTRIWLQQEIHQNRINSSSEISILSATRRSLPNFSVSCPEKQRAANAGTRQNKRLHSCTNEWQTKERTCCTSYPQSSFVKMISFAWKIWLSENGRVQIAALHMTEISMQRRISLQEDFVCWHKPNVYGRAGHTQTNTLRETM